MRSRGSELRTSGQSWGEKRGVCWEGGGESMRLVFVLLDLD